MIAIIDYDAGNLGSVEKALQYLGETPVITRDREEILRADKVILPGVGAFGDAMRLLTQYELPETIRQAVQREIPLLGICLGQQLLFEESEESPGVKGLGILPGKIFRRSLLQESWRVFPAMIRTHPWQLPIFRNPLPTVST